MFRKLFGQDDVLPVFARCSSCNRAIHNGQRYWSVQYAIESFDGSSVTVHDAVTVAFYCADCASERDFEQIQVPLKQ